METNQIWKDLVSAIVALALLALAITLTMLLNGGDFPTTMLPFDLDDRSISYPIEKDTIGGVTNVIVNTIITLGLVILWLCCYRKNYGSNKALFFLIIYMVLMGGVLVNLLTNFIKHFRGGLRPHFIAACEPNKEIVDELKKKSITWVNLTLTKTICTHKGKPEYRWSFPSGHSSEAFFGGILSILIIQHINHKDLSMGKQWGPLWVTIKASLQFALITFSSWVAVSRLVDYHHHWWDVLAGSLLGTVFAAVLFYWFLEPVMKEIASSSTAEAESSGYGDSVSSRTYYGSTSPTNHVQHAKSSQEP